MRTYDPPGLASLQPLPLSSTGRLASLHARRAVLYEALDLLLSGIDDNTALHPWRERLAPSPVDGAYRCAGILREVVCAFEAPALAAARKRLTATGVLGVTSDSVTHAPECWHEVGAEPTCPAEEPAVLARLAHGTAIALRNGDLIEASVLCDLQMRILRDHSRACLVELAGRLVDSGPLAYANIGLALRDLVDDDFDLLEPPRVSNKAFT